MKAAKKGAGAFNDWVNGLSNWNPVKWAIKGAPSELLYELIRYLAGM
ncbi:hypothetical protein AB0F13_02940 [Streptomyces sp. NPDC026206]